MPFYQFKAMSVVVIVVFSTVMGSCKSSRPSTRAPEHKNPEDPAPNKPVDPPAKSSSLTIDKIVGSYEEVCETGSHNLSTSYTVDADGLVTGKVTFREGPRCGGDDPGNETYVIEEVFQLEITSTKEKVSEVRESIQKIEVTPLTDKLVDTFNKDNIHGISSWKKGVATSILGPKGPYKKGDVRYNIVGVIDGVIYSGKNPSENESQRPTSLDLSVGKKKI